MAFAQLVKWKYAEWYPITSPTFALNSHPLASLVYSRAANITRDTQLGKVFLFSSIAIACYLLNFSNFKKRSRLIIDEYSLQHDNDKGYALPFQFSPLAGLELYAVRAILY